MTGFNQAFRTPIEKKGDAERARHLARRVKPFLLRRTKEEVANELPPKTEIVERIDMERSSATSTNPSASRCTNGCAPPSPRKASLAAGSSFSTRC